MNDTWRFLAVDLDGTVVDGASGVSQATIEVFAALRARGLKLLVATGRSRRSALPWVEILAARDGLICHNGAAVYDAAGKLLTQTVIPESEARSLVELSRSLPYHFHGFVGDEWLFERIDAETERYEKRSGFKGRKVDFDSIPDLGFNKAMFVATEEDVPAISSRIRVALGDSVEIYPTGSGFVEVVAPGVSKGVSLDFLVQRLGGSMSEVIAFGDAGNDEDMLRKAGLGIAMGDASDELKERIGRVTAKVSEDGVATWLTEFFKLENLSPILVD
ncbi:MAG: HAD family hydrolase [Spirochaetota bacterium]